MSRFNVTLDLSRIIDRRCFCLGMTAAFCEVVAVEAKRSALTPPPLSGDYDLQHLEMEKIIRDSGLRFLSVGEWYARSPHAPKGFSSMLGGFPWLIYKFDEVKDKWLAMLDEYEKLSKAGYSVEEAEKEAGWYNLLSYGMVWGENAEKVIPKMRAPIGPASTTIQRVVHGVVQEKAI